MKQLKIAEMTLSNNHSLTHFQYTCTMKFSVGPTINLEGMLKTYGLIPESKIFYFFIVIKYKFICLGIRTFFLQFSCQDTLTQKFSILFCGKKSYPLFQLNVLFPYLFASILNMILIIQFCHRGECIHFFYRFSSTYSCMTMHPFLVLFIYFILFY